MIYNFNDKSIPNLTQIGGKAKSLMEATGAGFLVPSGIVLSVDFFKNCMEKVKRSELFTTTLEDITKENCDKLKVVATSIILNEMSHDDFEQALQSIEGDYFAVRSSSPEEDLEGMSFAGMYETYLGIKRINLKQNIALVFASCFDYRVMAYKQQHGLNINETSIAIIIQQQIMSDVSGVGFSVNPMTNDHDEVMINANYGLGESVVSGLVNPDQYVVHKYNLVILDKIIGEHKAVIDVSLEGGITELSSESDALSLSDEQAVELTQCMIELEKHYGFPVDVEWTYKDHKLYVLQVRPITTYIPIEAHMMTKPTEKRMLYMDANLVDALTNNVPILPLTIDWYYGAVMMFAGPIFGDVKFDGHLPPKKNFFFHGTGRVYVNLSHILHLTKLDKLMATGSDADKQLGEIAKNIDTSLYKIEKPLFYLKKWFLFRKSPKWIWNSRKLIKMLIYAYYKPHQYYNKGFKPNVERVIKLLKSDVYKEVPLTQLRKAIDKDLDNALFYYCWPAIVPLMMALKKIPKLVKDGSQEMDELADAIFLGTSGNESIELGIAMYHMAKLLDKSDFDDLDALSSRIENNEMSQEFMLLWETFIEVYRYRGPNELELSNHRYGDDYKIALQQMSYMVDSNHNPEAAHLENIQKREDAYNILCDTLKGRKLKQFKQNYEIATLYSTARDKPKYIWLLENGIYRTRALLEGEVLVKKDKIDKKEDVFYLYFDELDKANNDEPMDLRDIISKRKAYYQTLDKIHSFPILMDSRGRIMTSKPSESEAGIIKGHGISRGIKTGRVKVLRHADEKPIEKGDVLVTYTTDPGWTPLFVNAEAIILQVGGPLQHGGVVAREYGKPCVAGITGIYDVFEDGQLVEVDGTNGQIRIIE